jgi:hypothetical protein
LAAALCRRRRAALFLLQQHAAGSFKAQLVAELPRIAAKFREVHRLLFEFGDQLAALEAQARAVVLASACYWRRESSWRESRSAPRMICMNGQ